MGLSRRGFLAGILAAGVAPAIVHNPMKIFVPKTKIDVVRPGYLPDLTEWDENQKYVKRFIIPGLIDAPRGFDLSLVSAEDFIKKLDFGHGPYRPSSKPTHIPVRDPSTPLEWMSFETGHHQGGMFA